MRELVVMFFLSTGFFLFGQQKSLTLSCANQMAPDVVVYTFRTDGMSNDQNASDRETNAYLSAEIEGIIDELSKINGVSEVYFDRATALYTVVGTKLSDFTPLLNP